MDGTPSGTVPAALQNGTLLVVLTALIQGGVAVRNQTNNSRLRLAARVLVEAIGLTLKGIVAVMRSLCRLTSAAFKIGLAWSLILVLTAGKG